MKDVVIFGWPSSTNVYASRNHSILGESGLGNPYRVSEFGREKAIELFRRLEIPRIRQDPALMTKLRGAVSLGCFCKIDQNCHVDELIKLI